MLAAKHFTLSVLVYGHTDSLELIQRRHCFAFSCGLLFTMQWVFFGDEIAF